MKYIALLFVVNCVIILSLFSGCNGQNKNEQNASVVESSHFYKNIFGEKYLATGHYENNNGDSIETNLWFITNLTTPVVISGQYLDGLPKGEWKFGFKDATVLSTQWLQYRNAMTKCSFSLPFQFNETLIDSNHFRLRIMNDSLGKISIIVGVSDTVSENQNLFNFKLNSETGLREKGYSLKDTTTEIAKAGARYFFTEYFMTDSVKKDVKLYHLYGNTPSRHHFVEFLLFHDGPKEEVVKIIYNLMSTSLYIDNERFFNPHLN